MSPAVLPHLPVPVDHNGLMNRRARSGHDAIDLLYAVQSYAGSFGGQDLLAAAEHAAQLSSLNGWRLLAADSSGERIVGVASTLGECYLADTAWRHDGVAILLVAGAIAGQFGLARAAWIARSMGASEVHCAYIGGWEGGIPGCDSVQLFPRNEATRNVPDENSLSRF